jgi:gamma-glutamylcyclotransferase (GGCT)/AIG2-like uncharacterized protein YtfP
VSHVFTYGSLMFGKVWSRVVTGRYIPAAARLAGFCRQRVRGQDYPALLSAPPGMAGEQRVVDGVLYLDVEASDLAALDGFEGPDYRRIQVEVTVGEQVPGGPPPGGMVLADAYLYVAADKVESGPWDPQEFERERMDRFLREYAPFSPAP